MTYYKPMVLENEAVKIFRYDFPLLNAQKKVYLDNAATSQKPESVIRAVETYYAHHNANIHRGKHGLSNEATIRYENVRKKVADFIHADSAEEIVFTRGTTESINLIAQSFVKYFYDTVMVSELEHHSNIVPWQLRGYVQGEGLIVIPVDENLNIRMEALETLLRENPGSFVSITHVSNAFGIINPIKEIIDLAHKHECLVMVDGAQAVPHMEVNVQELDVDFYAFSGHKMFGPTGIGVLYGKKELLEQTRPYQGGGAMIESVSFEGSSFLPPPHRFEAGTQNIAGTIGLGAAVDYIRYATYGAIRDQESSLIKYALEKLHDVEGITLYTQASNIEGILSFNIEGLHHDDIGTLLDKQNISVRTGHHCAQPAMKKLGIEGTVRASLAFYNTHEEIDAMIKALNKAIKMLKG